MNDETVDSSIRFDDLDLLDAAAIEAKIDAASKQLVFDIAMPTPPRERLGRFGVSSPLRRAKHG